jgi:uncharacterized protein
VRVVNYIFIPNSGIIIPIMGTATSKDSLADTLFSKTRQTILSLLYGRADGSFFVNQIIQFANMGTGTIQRELKQLAESGIILRETRGNQVYYKANADCPVFEELKSLADKGIFSCPGRYQNERNPRIKIPRAKIAEFCRRHHIQKLSFFGSVLTDAFKPDSDIDVLVEFEAGHTPGWDMVSVENELSTILGHKVDLHTKGDLSKYFRDSVVREAQVQYAAK